jgi:hypothetical protein
MHPTLLLPTLFYIVTLLAVVSVRVLFTSVLCGTPHELSRRGSS